MRAVGESRRGAELTSSIICPGSTRNACGSTRRPVSGTRVEHDCAQTTLRAVLHLPLVAKEESAARSRGQFSRQYGQSSVMGCSVCVACRASVRARTHAPFIIACTSAVVCCVVVQLVYAERLQRGAGLRPSESPAASTRAADPERDGQGDPSPHRPKTPNIEVHVMPHVMLIARAQ